MTGLSDREKALVEAAQDVSEFNIPIASIPYQVAFERLQAALRAYDPPKPKVPVLPTWVDLRAVAIKGDDVSMLIQSDKGVAWVGRADYEVLREATAKEQK